MRSVLAAPLLLAMACTADDSKIATWQDHDLETFDIHFLSDGSTLPGIGYNILELATGEGLDTDGHKNFTLPIEESTEVTDWDFDRDEKTIYVSSEWWCETAIPWLNVYTQIVSRQDLCVEDTAVCGEYHCDSEVLQALYDEALHPSEEEDSGDSVESI